MMGRKRFVALCLLVVICAPAFAATETEYLAVFMDGKKIGHAVHTRAETGGEVTTSDDVTMTISRLGIPVTIKTTETSVETTAGKPLRFESVQQLGAMTMKVAGTVNANGVVDVVSSSLGAEQKSTIPWPAGAVMAEGLRLVSLQKGLKPGVEYTVDVFYAGLMQVVKAKVTVGQKKPVDLLGRVVKLTEVTTTLNMPGAGQITSTTFVDDEMQALKSVVPIAGMSVEMIDCPKEFALGNNDVVEMIDKMFVKSPEPIQDVGSASSITYTLNPGKTADLMIPSTDNQTAQRLPDGRILLVIKPATVAAGGTFPYKGNDPKLLEAVKPTRFLQSDDKRDRGPGPQGGGRREGRGPGGPADRVVRRPVHRQQEHVRRLRLGRRGGREPPGRLLGVRRADGGSVPGRRHSRPGRRRRRVRERIRRPAGLRRPRLDAGLRRRR